MFGLKLIDHAWRDLHRLWTVRLAIAHAAFTGIAAVLSAFVDVFNPWFLVVVSVFVSIAIVLLRLVQQTLPPPTSAEIVKAANSLGEDDA